MYTRRLYAFVVGLPFEIITMILWLRSRPEGGSPEDLIRLSPRLVHLSPECTGDEPGTNKGVWHLVLGFGRVQ